MDELMLLDAVERYLRGEMQEPEKSYFEELRRNSPDIDQLVVEHSFFLEEMKRYSDVRNFRHSLHDVDLQLRTDGEIRELPSANPGKLLSIWNKYKRTIAIAAGIAGITTLATAAVLYLVAPKPIQQIQQLSKKFESLETRTNRQTREINDLKGKITEETSATPARYGGTGFLIDGKGYLVTNRHVVANAKRIAVQNEKGMEYDARTVFVDESLDLAILKIDDPDFESPGSLPYAIRRSTTDLAEPIFTLGYPRDEVVYGQGYLSARTGFNGDTLTCQIAIEANPGNSGGPVFNRHGEVVGILSTRQLTAEGVVFAVQSKNIYRALELIRQDTSIQESIRIPTQSSIRKLDRVQQVKKIQEYVFMVKGY